MVGGFYGPTHSREWWLGAVLSTAIPVIYAFTGGMRASIMTDASQARRTACWLQTATLLTPTLLAHEGLCSSRKHVFLTQHVCQLAMHPLLQHAAQWRSERVGCGGQIVITIGFLIVLMVVIGIHAPVDLGTFNPAGPPPHPPLTLPWEASCAPEA